MPLAASSQGVNSVNTEHRIFIVPHSTEFIGEPLLEIIWLSRREEIFRKITNLANNSRAVSSMWDTDNS